jgi:[acyl-carrier-protein] S-malonyltransferase
MTGAVEPFEAAIRSASFANASVAVLANVDAEAHTSGEDWRHLLVAQLTAPVRWRETVQTMARLGVERVLELGAAPRLAPLVERADATLQARTVTRPEEL